MARATWLLPEELKKARERLGLSLPEAAERAGIPEGLLRQWEEGLDAPALEQASSLADLYHTSLQRLLQPSSEAPRHDLRAERRMEQDEQERFIKEAASLFEHWCDTAAQIEELAGPREVRLRTIDVGEPGVLADAIRQEYNLGGGPIGNIRKFVEQDMGVLVFSLALNGVSGMSWWNPRAGPAILVNSNDSTGRQNWTLVHELAHLLRRDAVIICDTLRVNYGEPRERFADTFAAEFLLPRQDLTRYVEAEGLGPALDQDYTLNVIARRYRVTREATARRLESLGFLPRGFTDDQLPRWLELSLGKPRFGKRTARRRQRVKQLGRSFVGRAIEAYRGGQVTLSKLAEDLSLGTVEAEELVAEWPNRGGSR